MAIKQRVWVIEAKPVRARKWRVAHGTLSLSKKSAESKVREQQLLGSSSTEYRAAPYVREWEAANGKD